MPLAEGLTNVDDCTWWQSPHVPDSYLHPLITAVKRNVGSVPSVPLTTEYV